MTTLIIGAAGMIGRKIAASVANEQLVLADVVQADPLPGAQILTLDLTAPDAPMRLLETRPSTIYHLAAIVSGEAEADFDKGYAVNLDSIRTLLEAIRHIPNYSPRFVYASSAAVFGRPFPDAIPDDFHLVPLTSYGTQKAIAELLVNDYSRRGFIDGVSLRLPTICIRPGLPNRAASSFFSNILREPLAGKSANLPVPDSTRHWFASPRAAVGFFRHAATMDTSPLGTDRAITVPGLTGTVADQLAALQRAAGPAALKLITRNPDPAVERIVGGWALEFTATRALTLGFQADRSFDDIIAAHLAENP
ncbi:MAG: D-erythronate dehydrogenase [Alphaproteobacteria bacterium]